MRKSSTCSAHFGIAKAFLPQAHFSWLKVDAKTQADVRGGERTIAHIRNPGRYDEVATGSLASEINFMETPRNTPPLFVSYYTENTPYDALASELRSSLDRFRLPHRIEPIRSRGRWVANTGLKAETIMQAWRESEGPICWIDADAELLREPYIVFDNPFDIAMVRRNGWHDMSGFVYFGKSVAAKSLIACWTSLCRDHPDIWDQVLLTVAWYRVAGHTAMSSLWLHEGIFRFPRAKIRDWRDRLIYYPLKRKVRPLINQKQASRQLKALVDASKESGREYSSNDVNIEFRVALQHFDLTFDARLETILEAKGTNVQ